MSVIGNSRHARARGWPRTWVQFCPALAGQAIRHLQQDRADDRERDCSAQEILGRVRWRLLGLAEAGDRRQVLAQLPELPTSNASWFVTWPHTRWVPS